MQMKRQAAIYLSTLIVRLKFSCDFHDNAATTFSLQMTCHYVHDGRETLWRKTRKYTLLRTTIFSHLLAAARISRSVSHAHVQSHGPRPLIDISIPANLSSVTFAFGRPGYCIPFHRKKVRRQVIQMVR